LEEEEEEKGYTSTLAISLASKNHFARERGKR
jgi:hypothetical protein